MPTSNLTQNAYEILGLSRWADAAEVRQAYRALALVHHPDHIEAGRQEAAAAIFVRIVRAHEILSDPGSRARYDLWLDRGITPDLDSDIGDAPPHRSVGESLAMVRGMRLDADHPHVLAKMDYALRRQVLEAGLIRDESFHENVLDAIPIKAIVESAGFARPPGKLEEGWLVLTDFRILTLMKFLHEYQSGNTKYHNIHVRANSFAFYALGQFRLHERGRSGPVQSLEIAGTDGVRLRLDCPGSRLPRLLLAANAYSVPLKLRAVENRRRALTWAWVMSLALPVLWLLPFALVLCMKLFQPGSNTTDGPSQGPSPSDVLAWLSDHYITDVVAYLAAPLGLLSWLKFYRAWCLDRPDDVLGPPPVDYARGVDSLTQAREGAGPLKDLHWADDLALRWVAGEMDGTGWDTPPPPGNAGERMPARANGSRENPES